MPEEFRALGDGRLLATLERLLSIQAVHVKDALDQSSELVAEALGAEKVDAFLYDPTRDTLVAVGSSDTPMAALQIRLGLNVVPVANGGHTVEVYQTGQPFRTGHADREASVLVGIWRGLGVRSIVSVPLLVGGDRRGVLEVDSSAEDGFSDDDARFLEAVAHWVGMVAQQAELTEHVARDSADQARRVAADELIAVLAHDLRTPLTAAQGYLQLLHRRAMREGRDEEAEFASRSRQALTRLGNMIRALLDANRLEQGLFALARAPVDLVQLVRETTETLATPSRPINTVLPPDLLIEQADPERLRQALENLLGNALQHGPDGVPVVVDLSQETRDDGTWVILRVHDEGPGIPPSLIPTLFERFARGSSSSGLGLGLYLARGIVEAHGGTLTVDEHGESGTTFCLSLPCAGVPESNLS
jgi:two-component system OmpR family sensor kinase